MFPTNTTNEQTYFTPKEIIDSLGPFDLDPCTSQQRPWDTAKTHYTKKENGLKKEWFGRVWMNPPYNRYQIGFWLEKMSHHQNGITLVFSRTGTKYWQEFIWKSAFSILFLNKRIKFYDKSGRFTNDNGGADSALISYTEFDAYQLDSSEIVNGHHQLINPQLMIIVSAEKRTWRIIIGQAMEELKEAELPEIYDKVLEIGTIKVNRNKNWKAKVRQTLQYHFNSPKRGKWTSLDN